MRGSDADGLSDSERLRGPPPSVLSDAARYQWVSQKERKRRKATGELLEPALMCDGDFRAVVEAGPGVADSGLDASIIVMDRTVGGLCGARVKTQRGEQPTWSADSSWYSERPPGFWARKKRGSYIDLPAWMGLRHANDEPAREHLLEVMLTFPLGERSRTRRLRLRSPSGREVASGPATLRDCAEELGVKRVGVHEWQDACPPKGCKPDICAALCALASSGRGGSAVIRAWLRRERKRQEKRECYRQQTLREFVCPDTLTLIVRHGYIATGNIATWVNPPPKHEMVLRTVWRTAKELLKLRQVSTAFRVAVDCDAVWERFYVAVSEGKRYQPPAIRRLLGLPTCVGGAESVERQSCTQGICAQERLGAAGSGSDADTRSEARCLGSQHLPHLVAFRLAVVEHGRAALTADDLCGVTFYSRAKRHKNHTVEQLEAVCPWWRREEPRRHRFGRDGILRSYTYDPVLDSTVFDRQVGPWRFVAAPPGFPQKWSYVCTEGRATAVWEVRRTVSWDIILVTGAGIKCTAQFPDRADDTGGVGPEFEMSEVVEKALHTAARTIGQGK